MSEASFPTQNSYGMHVAHKLLSSGLHDVQTSLQRQPSLEAFAEQANQAAQDQLAAGQHNLVEFQELLGVKGVVGDPRIVTEAPKFPHLEITEQALAAIGVATVLQREQTEALVDTWARSSSTGPLRGRAYTFGWAARFSVQQVLTETLQLPTITGRQRNHVEGLINHYDGLTRRGKLAQRLGASQMKAFE